LTEIYSGESLNALLRHLIARQDQGAQRTNVPLSEKTLQSIHLTAGGTREGVALLQGNGCLQWPEVLQGEGFRKGREDLNRGIQNAVNAVQLNRRPDRGTVEALRADLQGLHERVDAGARTLAPDEYIRAKRYLRLVGSTVTALEGPHAFYYLNGNWTAKGKNVAELIQFMAENGLSFAPATPSDEPAYRALYHALAAFDARMPRMASADAE
jgi:hypothetical protein